MRTSIVSWLVGSAAVVAGVSVFSCRGVDSDSLVDCEETRTCQSGTASGDGGADANVVVPAGCDLAKSPKDAPSCVDDGVGVFVSPTGSDGAAGTKSAPLKSVAKGVEVASTRGLPRVYVCEGTYAESVTVGKSVSIFGGFSCAGFAYSGTKPRVQPGEGAKVALDVTASNVVVADVHLLGPEQGAPNSVAVRVLNANGVVFERVKLEGRAGADGAKGTRTDFTGFPLQAALDGNNAAAGGPGDAKEVSCPGGVKTTGGKGGASGFDGAAGMPSLGGGAGGTISQCQLNNQGGGPGAGAPSAPGAAGAAGAGTLVSDGWSPSPGKSGEAGSPGQGGGGGGGLAGGNGGGGGAGGCGGAGGGGGGGGGASVALLSIGSDVTLRASELVTAKGGSGGAGIAGQAGQSIFGFGGNKTGGGCNGGNGGPGGTGGAGGGGAGGISVAILHKGTKPTTSDTTITKGTAGAKGAGGAPGTNDGIDGVSADQLEVP